MADDDLKNTETGVFQSRSVLCRNSFLSVFSDTDLPNGTGFSVCADMSISRWAKLRYESAAYIRMEHTIHIECTVSAVCAPTTVFLYGNTGAGYHDMLMAWLHNDRFLFCDSRVSMNRRVAYACWIL